MFRFALAIERFNRHRWCSFGRFNLRQCLLTRRTFSGAWLQGRYMQIWNGFPCRRFGRNSGGDIVFGLLSRNIGRWLSRRGFDILAICIESPALEPRRGHISPFSRQYDRGGSLHRPSLFSSCHAFLIGVPMRRRGPLLAPRTRIFLRSRRFGLVGPAWRTIGSPVRTQNAGGLRDVQHWLGSIFRRRLRSFRAGLTLWRAAVVSFPVEKPHLFGGLVHTNTSLAIWNGHSSRLRSPRQGFCAPWVDGGPKLIFGPLSRRRSSCLW